MLGPTEKIIKNQDPAARMQELEFQEISLRFGSFIAMTQNKCLNHISIIAIIIKNEPYKRAFMSLIGSDNIYELIQSFIDSVPNLYKKVAKKTLFK